MISLVLGGARSGKSRVAEEAAARTGETVTYLATLNLDDQDSSMQLRVEEHRRRRPVDWVTRECADDLVDAIRSGSGTLLIDSLGTWVASHLNATLDSQGLIDALVAYAGNVIIVSEEVGLGVHPSSEVGGRFRDALGLLNQAVAGVADRVVLVVAGCELNLKAP